MLLLLQQILVAHENMACASVKNTNKLETVCNLQYQKLLIEPTVSTAVEYIICETEQSIALNKSGNLKNQRSKLLSMYRNIFPEIRTVL